MEEGGGGDAGEWTLFRFPASQGCVHLQSVDAHSPPPLQAHLKDLEQRLAQSAGELSLAHSGVAELERRLTGCLLKAEADMMVQRLGEAEEAAGKGQAAVSGLSYRAQVGMQGGGEDGRECGNFGWV